jgi:hypothetical protein
VAGTFVSAQDSPPAQAARANSLPGQRKSNSPATNSHPERAGSTEPAALGPVHPDAINDPALMAALREQLISLMQDGKAVSAEVLREQLHRSHHDISHLPEPSGKTLAPERTYLDRRDSTVVIGGLYKCDKCEDWHVSIASAFPIAEPDIFVSNYHVFADSDRVAFAGMTRLMKMQPVAEILAANRGADVAIFRIPGLGVTPLALRDDAPVGTPVSVISHPADHFFSLYKGVISRYVTHEHQGRKSFWMEISADFAMGSSGAPILDDRGNAVAMVAMTQPVFKTPEDYHSVQMVFKECVPAATIRALITPPRNPSHNL